MDARIGNVVRLLQAGPFDERTLRRVRAGLSALRGHRALAEELGNLVVLLDDFAESAPDKSVGAGAYLLAAELCEAGGMQDQFVERISLAMDADPTDKNTPRRLRQALNRPADRPRLLALLGTRARALEEVDPEGTIAAEAFAHLASEYEKDGEIGQAIEHYDHALELEPTVGTVEALASLYARRRKDGDADQAADLYCMLADVVPEGSARGLLKRALTLVPGHADATRRLAAITASEEAAAPEPARQSAPAPAQPIAYTDGVNTILPPPKPALTAPPPAAMRPVLSAPPPAMAVPAVAVPTALPAAPRPATLAPAAANMMLPPALAPAPTSVAAPAAPVSEAITTRRPQAQVPPSDSALDLAPALPRAPMPVPAAVQAPIQSPIGASATPDALTMPFEGTDGASALQPTHVMATPRPTPVSPSLSPAADLPNFAAQNDNGKPWRQWAISSAVTAGGMLIVFFALSPLRQPADKPLETSAASATVPSAPPEPATPTTLAAEAADDNGNETEQDQGVQAAATPDSDKGAEQDAVKEAEPEQAATREQAGTDMKPDARPRVRKRANKPEVAVIEKRARIRGAKVPKRKVLAAMDRSMPKLERCYRRALRREPTLEGRLVYNVRVRRAGKAGSVKKVAGDIRDQRLMACTSKVLEGTRFPKFTKGRVAKVRLPLRFKADS